MDADFESHHSDTLAGIKVETEEMPISIKAEPGGPDDYDVKDKPSDKIDTLFDTVRDHSSSDSKLDCLQIEARSMGDDKEFLESQPKFIKEQHKNWSEDSSSSSSIKEHQIESDGADPSFYKLKSEDVDLGVLKMEEDEDNTESSKEEDVRSGEQNSARQQTKTHGEKLRKTFNCIKCKKKYLSKLCLDQHILRKHNDDGEMMKSVTYKIHRCEHCEYASIVKPKLINHMRMHGEKFGIIFDCIKCKKGCLSKQRLDNHIVKMHRNDVDMMKTITNKIHRCEHCTFATVLKTNITNHMRTHEGKSRKTFNCIKCEKEFLSKRSLDNHIVRKHNDDGEMMKGVIYKIHRCVHCQYVTVLKPFLTNHMRTHGEECGITFDCIKCKREFSIKKLLDNHIVKMHRNDVSMMNSITNKIHRCEYCKFATVVKTSLTTHIRTHGKKLGITFNCTECDKEFSSKRFLDNHIVTMHCNDVKMIKSVTHNIHRCKHCKYVTVIKTYLTNHMRTHGITFDCIKCKKEFTNKQRLDNHIVTMHSNDVKMMKSISYKIYHCQHCRYSTGAPYLLTKHMKTHQEKLGQL